MRFLKDTPIRRKLTVVVLTISGMALLVTAALLFWFQTILFRQSFERDLATLAEIIAKNSSAAVAFRDKSSAGEVLSALGAKPHIVAGRIELPDGSYLAAFGVGQPAPRRSDQPDGISTQGRYKFLTRAIKLEGKTIGTLLLWSDYRAEFWVLLRSSASILAGVLAVSILVSYLLSTLMQGIIAQPILRLAGIAQNIAAKKDYSLRADIDQNDETGQLTRAFNEMLAQIQSQDQALRQSRQRLEVALLGTNDGLWDWDVQTNRVYLSPRWKTMLGYAEEELPDARDTWERLIHAQDREATLATLRDYLDGRQPVFQVEFRMLRKDGSWAWILSRGAALRDEAGRPVRMAGSHTDITARKNAEQELARINQRLREASHQAGMAEVATGVLHNVGNVLNSVNISANLLHDRLAKSRVTSLVKTAQLLKPHAANPGPFFTTDPKGKLVPEFIIKLAEHLAGERQEMQAEVAALTKNVDHIKQIVAMQQSCAGVCGVIESLPPADLVEDAIRLNEAGLARHGIQLVRQFGLVAPVTVDRHQVMQILINVIRNAKYALDHGPQPDHKILTVTITPSDAGMVKISVADNGLGIAPENLTQIFSHGFTTKKDGHGFGLHASANAAKAIGGKLTAHSDGPGRGATFTLELPIRDSRAGTEAGQRSESTPTSGPSIGISFPSEAQSIRSTSP